jgi:hypothetical protein
MMRYVYKIFGGRPDQEIARETREKIDQHIKYVLRKQGGEMWTGFTLKRKKR